MYRRSLSSHMRDQVENFFEGPIPPEERERIRVVETAERSLEKSLPPIEQAMLGFRRAVMDVEHDTGLLEAARQLALDANDLNSRDAWEKLAERRRLMAIEAATWAQAKLEAVLKELNGAAIQKAA